MSYPYQPQPGQPQYPGQQPGYPQQGPPPQQYPPQQAGPPAPGYGPPPQQGYGPPAPPQGYDQGYGAVAEPNWQAMSDIADTSTGGEYEPGWWPAHPIACEYGLTRKQDKYAWTPVFQFDGGPNNGRKMTTTLAISERKNDGSENPGGTAKLYRQVGAMGVPVGDKFDQPGVTPFWHLGWSGEQVAGFIAQTGAPVEIQVYWDKEWNNYKIGGIRKIRTGPGAPPMAAPQQAGPPAPGMQGPPPQAQYPPQQAPAPAMGGYQGGPVAQGYGPPQQAPGPQQGPPPGPPAYQQGPPPQGAPQQVPPPSWQPGQAQYPGQPGMAPPQQAQPQAGPPQQVPGPMPGNGYPQQPGMPQQGPPQQGGVPGPPWKQ